MKRMKLKPEIASYIWRLSDDTKVIDLLEVSLGRVLENASKGGISSMHLIDAQKATHITDWLTAAVKTQETWLSNTDADGRPKKLMKFSDVEGIMKEADKAMARLVQKSVSIQLVAGDEELYAELEDGFHVVRLLTANALDRESGTMQHCIGGGAYDERVETDNYLYLSIRDRMGKPRVSIELDMRSARGPLALQIYGKQNTNPQRRHLGLLQPFFRERGIRVGQVGDIVFDGDHNMHDLVAMPEETRVNGNMRLEKLDGLELPDTLRVDGDLDIIGCANLRLPRHLSVAGYMTVVDSSIVGQSEYLNVSRDLWLNRVETPPTGPAEFLRAAGIGAQDVPNWTEVVSGQFHRLNEFKNTGVEKRHFQEATERHEEMRTTELRQAKLEGGGRKGPCTGP
jgi:hypothetical protein